MSDSLPADLPSKPHLRWYQFRLRSLLLLMALVIGLLGGWWQLFIAPQVASYRRQQRAIAAIEELGGTYEATSAPEWLCRLTGQDLRDVTLVDLADCDDPDAYSDHVAALPRLEILAVGGDHFTDRHLERLGDLKALRGLVLDWTTVSAEAVDALKQRLQALEVYLSQRRLLRPTPGKPPHLVVLSMFADSRKDYPELRQRLREGFFWYTDGLIIRADKAEGDAPLTRLWQMQRSQHLDIRVPGATDASLRHLSRLADLKTLELDDTPITSDGLAALKPLSKLSRLSLSHAPITNEALAHLQNVPSLSSLTLNNTKITNEGLAHLQNLPNLSSLALSNNSITGEGLSLLKPMVNLTDLHLGGDQITDEGLSHASRLVQLQALTLAKTQISDRGLRHLEGMPLNRLGLNNTKITDEGLAAVATIDTLQVLLLSETAITDRGLAHLKQLPQLNYLSMFRTGISDAGVATLKEMRGLRFLFLARTRVTDEGIEQLRKALPKCRIDTSFGK